MARDTLTNRSVISTIDKNLTAVSIDIDQHQRLAAQFNIQCVPTVLVLSPEGRILQRTTGYQSATQLLKTIQPFTRSAQPSRSPIGRNERR
jgi:thioredoxin-like negative regulator of GroEL